MGLKTAGKFYYDGPAVAIAVDTPIAFTSDKAVGAVSLAADNTTVRISRPGLYRIAANVTFIATAAGTVEATLYADGGAVAGARGSETLAAVGDAGSVSFETLLTVLPACPGSVAQLTLVNTGVATSIEVANLIVEKVA